MACVGSRNECVSFSFLSLIFSFFLQPLVHLFRCWFAYDRLTQMFDSRTMCSIPFSANLHSSSVPPRDHSPTPNSTLPFNSVKTLIQVVFKQSNSNHPLILCECSCCCRNLLLLLTNEKSLVQGKLANENHFSKSIKIKYLCWFCHVMTQYYIYRATDTTVCAQNRIALIAKDLIPRSIINE